MGMTVLLTGGAGYVGSHTIVALLDAGHRVHVVDNLSRGRREAIQRAARLGGHDVPLSVIDLCDESAITELIGQVNPDVVLHVAAYKSVSESVAHPERYDRNNTEATTVLARAIEAHGVRRVVYASTGSVYGERSCEGFLETDPTAPLNPYAATKLAGEHALNALSERTGAHVANMRFFNVVGAHPSGELGEYGDESTNLLPLLLDQLVGKRGALTIFGTDWDTPDGTCIRDYVHVCDIASALVAACERVHEIDGSRVFNVGTGIGTSVRAMVAAVAKAAGQDLPTIDGPRREGDPGLSVAGVQRIADELGWTATYDLPAMVQSAVQWSRREPAPA